MTQNSPFMAKSTDLRDNWVCKQCQSCSDSPLKSHLDMESTFTFGVSFLCWLCNTKHQTAQAYSFQMCTCMHNLHVCAQSRISGTTVCNLVSRTCWSICTKYIVPFVFDTMTFPNSRLKNAWTMYIVTSESGQRGIASILLMIYWGVRLSYVI